MTEAGMNAQDIGVRREPITSNAAKELILALNAELSERYPDDGTANHFRLDADEVAHGRGAFLVAYAGDKALACGAIRLLDADTAEIKRMYVEPSARGLGLGRRLLGALEAEARILGVKKIVLETGPRQPEAIALYSRAGFSRIAAFGEYESSPLCVFMGKEL
ncbi:MAG: GNAT family N-acetyltransferase [Armatimonadota bacterium]